MPRKKQPASAVSRVSVSLPGTLLGELDRMVARRGFESRSQAVSDMVNTTLVEHKRKLGNEVMVGTLTLHYDRSVRGLQRTLADIQFKFIDEVISSLHVHLSHDQMLEVILVQGRAQQLQQIADQMMTRRGVITGRLHVLAAAIPQIQLAS
ncbi:MAG: transcriptional regulator [Ramlibacter sp.]